MYPMSVILLVAAIRRDAAVRWYVLVQLGVGIVIAAYHTQLQAFPPRGGSPFCTTTEPCTTRFVWEFGFVSIPFMSLAAFVLVTVLVIVARPQARGDAPA
jgi:disulfide bond formation protein DsbB